MPCSYGIYFYFSPNTPKNTLFSWQNARSQTDKNSKEKNNFYITSNVPSSFLKAVSTFALEVFLHSLDFHLFFCFASNTARVDREGKEKKNVVWKEGVLTNFFLPFPSLDVVFAVAKRSMNVESDHIMKLFEF
jgi:hypothetical protein